MNNASVNTSAHVDEGHFLSDLVSLTVSEEKHPPWVTSSSSFPPRQSHCPSGQTAVIGSLIGDMSDANRRCADKQRGDRWLRWCTPASACDCTRPLLLETKVRTGRWTERQTGRQWEKRPVKRWRTQEEYLEYNEPIKDVLYVCQHTFIGIDSFLLCVFVHIWILSVSWTQIHFHFPSQMVQMLGFCFHVVMLMFLLVLPDLCWSSLCLSFQILHLGLQR